MLALAIVCFWAAEALDYLTTRRAIRVAGHETNRLLGPGFQRVWIKVVSAVFFFAVTLLFTRSPATERWLWLGAGVYFGLAVWNALQLRHAR